MPDDGHRLPWTDEQWATVQRTVQEAARKARVASSFLPLVGPLPDGQASVPALGMAVQAPPHPWFAAANRLQIDDAVTLPLTTISCNVYLTTQQAEDPDLASAREMLERAAVVVGRLEDAIVFNGQAGPGLGPLFGAPGPAVFEIQGGDSPGLLTVRNVVHVAARPGANAADRLIHAIVTAIQMLEGNGHFAPFACVLGDALYLDANTPDNGLILPSDRIVPFLGAGPPLRSSAVPPGDGVVVALAGSPVDLVVASDVHVSYVQRSIEPRYVLRVSERFVLRRKQPEAVCFLTP